MSTFFPFSRTERSPDVPFASNQHPFSALPAASGLTFSAAGPMLRFEDAVVETVYVYSRSSHSKLTSHRVTSTTRTTTKFAPIPLPHISEPENIPLPRCLSTESYPLAHEPVPEDLKVFALNLGGQRVVIQEDGCCETGSRPSKIGGGTGGPGWKRNLVRSDIKREEGKRASLAQAIGAVREAEVRKRSYEVSRDSKGVRIKTEAHTPPVLDLHPVPANVQQHKSPPRKKVRGLPDEGIARNRKSALLSPLPSPEPEAGPSTVSSSSTVSPSIGSGLEVAAFFSLPSIIANFEALPDKLQQQVLMHLLRRSRMPTIQRISSFAASALRRDFISLLPHEVSLQILKLVDTKTLIAATGVSKKWRKMIDSEASIWRQRLMEDNLWIGLGVEREEENLVQRRIEIVESKALSREIMDKAGTPIEDEEMSSAKLAYSPFSEHPTAMKHVYRRRYNNMRNWLNQPQHNCFPGHGTNVITCLQFDADKIVSASDDHSINVYKTSTGVLMKRLDGHEGGVWALEYKGDTLVTGSTDRTVRVWDLESLTQAHVFHGHTSTVRCLQIVEPVFDPSTGEYQPPYPIFITGSRDTSLRVWKLPKRGEPPVVKSQVRRACRRSEYDLKWL